MEAAFRLDTLEDALATPDILNRIRVLSSLDSFFSSVLADNGIAISMDGVGSWRDNVFVGQLRRSVKYEEMCLL